MAKWGLSQECKTCSVFGEKKSTPPNYQKKKYMITSIDAEKAWQNPINIPDRNSQQTEGNFLNLIKGIYKKVTTNIILTGDRLNVFTKIQNKARMTLLFNILLKILVNAIRQKRQKAHMEKRKIIPIPDNMTV